jgi:DNA-binding NarL/FixJ family response regulator
LLLVTEHTMLSDILSDLIDDAPDLELAGEVSESDQLVTRALETNADVIVMCGPGQALPQEISRLFDVLPDVRVLSIDRRGAESFLYRLEATVRPLGELDPPALVAAMRSAARNPWSGLHLTRTSP